MDAARMVKLTELLLYLLQVIYSPKRLFHETELPHVLQYLRRQGFNDDEVMKFLRDLEERVVAEAAERQAKSGKGDPFDPIELLSPVRPPAELLS